MSWTDGGLRRRLMELSRLKAGATKLAQVRMASDVSLDIDTEALRLTRMMGRPVYRWEVIELMWEAYRAMTRNPPA